MPDYTRDPKETIVLTTTHIDMDIDVDVNKDRVHVVSIS